MISWHGNSPFLWLVYMLYNILYIYSENRYSHKKIFDILLKESELARLTVDMSLDYSDSDR